MSIMTFSHAKFTAK